MKTNNIIVLKPAEFLPRWKWEDLENILSEAIPLNRPQLTVLLRELKLDSEHMTSEEVLADLMLAISAAKALSRS